MYAPRLSLLALALGTALPALAQEAPKDRSQLETVVITAERRAENIKDVPNAVSKISGDKLDVLASGGQDVRFLSGRVPSLNIESSFGRAFPRFYIRGYGNTDFRLNASQPVSVIVDDVIQENPILKGFPIFDTAAIEVAAGPQGTLFGRNTPAGVVKFDSVKPSQKQDGYVSATVGNYGTLNLEGAANLPLSGDWAARISAQSQRRSDWAKNTLANQPTPKTEGYTDNALRAQVLFEPHKQFSALANIHVRDLDGSPRLFRANIIKRGTNDLVDGFDPEKMEIGGVNEQTLKQTGGSLRLKWSLPEINIYSISGYEKVKPFSRGDIDGGHAANGATPAGPGFIPFQSETASRMDGHRQLTQEVRVESNAAGPLRWQAGVYLFDERYVIDNLDYDPATHAVRSEILTSQSNKAYAAFGSVNYNLTNALQLRGGLRYTHDKKNLATTGTVNASNGTTAATNDGKWSGDLSLSYKLDADTNLYARYANGFRASSIQNASAFGPQSQAGPESINSYEVGFKSELLKRTLRLSGSLFSYTVKDLQLTAVGGSVNATRLLNAKKATGNGAELNLEALITPDLLVTFGGSLNNTKLKDAGLGVPPGGSLKVGGAFPTVLDPVVNGNAMIDGNALPNAPKWTYNLTARWSIPLASGDEVYVYTDWAYRSKVNFFLYEATEFTGKSLTEGGLRAGYLWGNGKYEVAGFVRNITNQVRVTGAIDFNNLTGFINDPRTYGVQFKALF
ncbi:iron complex outermembrane receptor protein [Pelomonas saccharophila]|uniref:Iron complex outermembrane receptor protein n=1 Tax=Roseateles saccharophilus TaxID=304 RepID=A0ABU1YPQ2_ROSSA|nr:TonB-dependent receptor [Roseateles saccharophilus]MDR7270841.1 iron complex outermembrane receptor protein [Roseateles saccharophilus]